MATSVSVTQEEVKLITEALQEKLRKETQVSGPRDYDKIGRIAVLLDTMAVAKQTPQPPTQYKPDSVISPPFVELI